MPNCNSSMDHKSDDRSLLLQADACGLRRATLFTGNGTSQHISHRRHGMRVRQWMNSMQDNLRPPRRLDVWADDRPAQKTFSVNIWLANHSLTHPRKLNKNIISATIKSVIRNFEGKHTQREKEEIKNKNQTRQHEITEPRHSCLINWNGSKTLFLRLFIKSSHLTTFAA